MLSWYISIMNDVPKKDNYDGAFIQKRYLSFNQYHNKCCLT